MSKGWIGVDLDGTLAEYTTWQGIRHIGRPIMPMILRAQTWISEGKEVRVMTARVADLTTVDLATRIIQEWCIEHIGVPLKVTCIKDFEMVELWDDRCVHVECNTGKILG